MQCAKHGIAAGPDGRCALCRREATVEGAKASRRALWRAGAGLGLLLVAILLARPVVALFSASAVPAPERPSAVARTAEPDLESAEVEASVEREAPTEPSRVATEEDAPDASLPPSSTDPELAPSPSAPDSALAAAPPSPAPSASQARPTEQALASAIRGTPITMFSTGWCGVCARARAFLAANDLRYSERDIDHDANAREELKRRTGKASIPTFEIDGELLTPGFSEQAVMAAVAKSAQRRLGVEKLELRRAQ